MSDNNDHNNNKERAANALVKKDLSEFWHSQSPSEEGLREIFERHGLTPNSSTNIVLISGDEIFLKACVNKRVNEGIIRCLIEYFPDAASATDDEDGMTPLHLACCNKSMTRGIIQLLIDAAPDTLRSVNNQGYMPLHVLCRSKKIRKMKAVEILELFIEKCPEAVRHAVNDCLPIHCALARAKSPAFCRVLIEAYPGSERIIYADDQLPLHYLPLHFACRRNAFATVEYLYKLYTDAINHASPQGYYPIHSAIIGAAFENSPNGVEIVHFLLDCDPNVKLQKFEGESLLHYACVLNFDDSNIDVALEIVKVIYDARPEAIEENRFVSDIQRYHQQVQSFVRSELVYARQAKDLHLMMTPDDNGRLPLHTALQNNVRLGSIKLLVKGNPSAIRTLENNFALPLHIACEHHDSASVVQYLVGLDTSTLYVMDKTGNTALHYACRGAKYDTIAILLEKHDAVSVSNRNVHNKLPIDVLWESNAVEDRENTEYTESVFRLLRAYPEML